MRAAFGRAALELECEPMIRGFIGVVHLPAMPGDPRAALNNSFRAVEEAALRDAEALVRGGVDALIVENFGSAPFVKGTAADRLPPHQVAAMAIVARRARELFGKPVGVNCLRSDAMSALGIAAAAELAFIRVNVHVGAYVTDQGLIEGEAAATLRYRTALGAPIEILADVLVKHATPLAPLSVQRAVSDTLQRGLADGLIVTGDATGSPVRRSLLEEVRTAAGGATVLVGSGMNPHNAAELAPLADGAIVGSYLKRDGAVLAPVDESRVHALAEILHERLRGAKA